MSFSNDFFAPARACRTVAGVLLLGAGLAAPSLAQDEIQLRLLSTYHSGVFDESAAEISAFDPQTQRVFVVNANDVSIDILDLSDPAEPSLISSVDIAALGGSANSVAVYEGLVAVAVEADAVDGAGKVVFMDADGTVLNQVSVGVLPDMLTFTPDGSKVLTANEGQPNDDYTVDPEGSVSIVDLDDGVSNASATTVSFASFTDADALRAQGVRVFGPGATPAQDFEPEYIALSADGATAYVAMQENNAIAVIDVNNASVTAIWPLGFKDHSQERNALDASNRDDAVNITTWPVLGMYMPDAMASYEVDGRTYLVTANEGDSRDYDGFSEEERVKDLTLDPIAFPDAQELQKDENIGRLKTTTTLGDIDGDGDFDKIYSYGARSFTIWNDKGELVFDSGDEFERITAGLLGSDFNSSNDENDGFDDRSDDKGPEPEAVAIGHLGNRIFAFIGLERVGGIMVYDITNPWRAHYVTYVTSRDFGVDFDPDAVTLGDLEAVGDLGPEGLVFVPADDSPNGVPLLIVSSEVSGSVSVYEIIEGRGLARSNTELYEMDDLPVLGVTDAGDEILLGGFSGLFFEGVAANGNLRFITHPDRGPNGDPIDTDGDGVRERPFPLPEFQAQWVRFEINRSSGAISLTGTVDLTRADGSTPISGLPNLAGTPGFAHADEVPIDLRGNLLERDPFGADMEGIVRAPDGTYWMCDEYRPAIYHFTSTGRLIERLVPEGSNDSGVDTGLEAIPAVFAQRRANRGFEAIAYQDGKVYGFIQSPIDNPDTAGDTNSRGGSYIRIVEIDASTNTTVGQYLYQIEGGGSDKMGDAVATSTPGEFLVIERDSRVGASALKKVFRISLEDATNLHGLSSALVGPGGSLEGLDADGLAAAGVELVSKEVFVDLIEAGYLAGDKPEGLALIDENTIAVINDNDFQLAGGFDINTGELDDNPNPFPVVVGIITVGDGKFARRNKKRAAVWATVTDLGTAVEDLTVTLWRGDNSWEGTTDADGRVFFDITVDSRRGATGYYRARATDADGAVVGAWSSIPVNGGKEAELLLPIGDQAFVVELRPLVVAKAAVGASGIALQGNTPNPFNPETYISYTLGAPGEVKLAVYNALGQQVRVLTEGFRGAGAYRALWDGRDAAGQRVSSGIYFYRLEHAEGIQTSRMTLLK